jgi:hypothetical protein
MTALIAGICGFVGSTLEETLEEIAEHARQNPEWLQISSP